MNNGLLAGPDVIADDKRVRLEARIEGEAPVVVGPGRIRHVGALGPGHEVRRGEIDHRHRRLGTHAGAPLGHVGGNPGGEPRHVCRRDEALSLVMAALGIRLPGRHPPGFQGGEGHHAHRLDLLVRLQGERRGTALEVAG